MQSLRTVTVLEHEVVPVLDLAPGADAASETAVAEAWLTEADAQALIRINDLRRGFCQRVSGGIKLAQYCGIVRLATCVLEVLPKIGMSDAREGDEADRARAALLTMLNDARRVMVSRVGVAPQSVVRAPLLDVFVEAFLLAAGEQARRGFLSRYVGHEEDLHVVKGRFHFHGHIRRNLARPHVLSCEFDEFTADNAYNRAIRAALDACRHWTLGPATQRLWFENSARFAGLTALRMTAADVAKLPRDRTTRRYTEVLTWCEWLLSLTSPALGNGTARAPALLFDMNKLFEAYVSSLEERAADDGCVVRRQGPAQALAVHGVNEAFALRPDLTVWEARPDGSDGKILRVLDAKWKRLDPSEALWGVEQADIYQLLAYAISYRCRCLELIYPHPADGAAPAAAEMPLFEIDAPGLGSIKIQVKTVPLWNQR